MYMIRTQIYLTNLENKGIQDLIKNNGGGTKAEHIRRAIDEYLNKKQNYIETNFLGNQHFVSPGIPSWTEPLPNPNHVGKKVKVIKGKYAGKTGIVIEHWINGDDCSGGYGLHLYQLDTHNYGCQNNSYGINVKDCEFID